MGAGDTRRHPIDGTRRAAPELKKGTSKAQTPHRLKFSSNQYIGEDILRDSGRGVVQLSPVHYHDQGDPRGGPSESLNSCGNATGEQHCQMKGRDNG